MMRKISLLAAMLLSACWYIPASALSIVSDFWPLTDEQQPDSCVYVAPDAVEAVTSVEVYPEGHRRCKINIDHLEAGDYSVHVFARNASMDSEMVPFSFTISAAPSPPPVLVPPVKLRCEPITCVLGE